MEINNKSAYELSSMLCAKEVSSEEVTKACLDRIEALEPKLSAFITVNHEEAIRKAKEVDQKRINGEKLHPLAGIPIGISDNICTKGVKTTCASRILENFVPPYDATVNEKLNQADMVLVGKLNIDEFAMGSSTENSYFIRTKNPYNLDCVPGGSSGGGAASVASFELPVALGTDTGGGLRQPASYCGVVGMKPTYGRVSRYGLIASASSMDQIGPITRNVEDMALMLNAICGHDKKDSSSAQIETPDFTNAIGNDINGMRIALPVEFLGEGIQPEVKECVLNAVKVFESLGATVDEVHMDYMQYMLPTYYLISAAEASSNLARFDGIKYGFSAEEYDDLEDLYRKTRGLGLGSEAKRRTLLGTFALTSENYDVYFKKALEIRTLIKNQFDKLFNTYHMVLTPTCPTTAFKSCAKTSPLEMYLSDAYTVPVNLAGLPALSINAGFDKAGLPIGIQFIGKVYDELTLIQLAHAYESNRKIEDLPLGI